MAAMDVSKPIRKPNWTQYECLSLPTLAKKEAGELEKYFDFHKLDIFSTREIHKINKMDSVAVSF